MTTLMAQPVQVPAGTVAAPSIKFGTGAIGLYRTGSFLGFSVKGVGVKRLGVLGQEVCFKTVTAKADATTMTAAELLGGYIAGTPTGAANYTTDTAALIDAAIPGVQTGDSFDCVVENRSGGANAITFLAGVGVTLRGSATTVGQAKSALLRFTRTGAAAWDVSRVVSA